MTDFDELFKKRGVYEISEPGQSRVSKNHIYKTVEEMDLLLDVYYPPDIRIGEQRPAVVLIHGMGPVEITKYIKDSGQYVSWGQLIATTDLIAVTFNHRSPNEHLSLREVASDIDDLIGYVRENAEELQIDKEMLAIWTCSAGVPLGIRSAFRDTPAFVKCFVAYYGPFDLQFVKTSWSLSEDELREFSAFTYLEAYADKLAPMFIAKAGIDRPEINTSIDAFIKEACAKNVTLDFVTHPDGHHAFDVLDNVARSHQIIKRTLEFMNTSLTRPSSRVTARSEIKETTQTGE